MARIHSQNQWQLRGVREGAFLPVLCCWELKSHSPGREDVEHGAGPHALVVTATVAGWLPCVCARGGQSFIREISSWQRWPLCGPVSQSIWGASEITDFLQQLSCINYLHSLGSTDLLRNGLHSHLCSDPKCESNGFSIIHYLNYSHHALGFWGLL